MATPKLSFRPGTNADAAALAVLVDIAGEGLPAFMWSRLKASGQSVLEFGRERARRDTGGFSHKNAVIAEIGGEIAAALVGYRLNAPYDLEGSLTEAPDIVRPLVRLEAKTPGSWYVNVLATFVPPAWHWWPATFHRRNQGARSGSACPKRHRWKLE